MTEVTKAAIKEEVGLLIENIKKTVTQINVYVNQSRKCEDDLIYADYLEKIGKLYIKLAQMVADKANLLKDLVD